MKPPYQPKPACSADNDISPACTAAAQLQLLPLRQKFICCIISFLTETYRISARQAATIIATAANECQASGERWALLLPRGGCCVQYLAVVSSVGKPVVYSGSYPAQFSLTVTEEMIVLLGYVRVNIVFSTLFHWTVEKQYQVLQFSDFLWAWIFQLLQLPSVPYWSWLQ